VLGKGEDEEVMVVLRAVEKGVKTAGWVLALENLSINRSV